jgi:hypothetical protein
LSRVVGEANTKKNVGIEAPKASFETTQGRFLCFFKGFASETPEHQRPLIESAEERRLHKTDETSRTLEEFAFGFEGAIRKTIDFGGTRRTFFLLKMK